MPRDNAAGTMADFAPPSTLIDQAWGSQAWRVVMASFATAPIDEASAAGAALLDAGTAKKAAAPKKKAVKAKAKAKDEPETPPRTGTDG